MSHRRPSAQLGHTVEGRVHQSHIGRRDGRPRLRPLLPVVDVGHVEQRPCRPLDLEGERARPPLVAVRHGQRSDRQGRGQIKPATGHQPPPFQTGHQRPPDGRFANDGRQPVRGVNRQTRHRHTLGAKLRQAADVAHVAVGQQNTIRRPQAIGAMRMRAERVRQVVQLPADIRRGVDEPHARRVGPLVHQGQASGAAATFGVGEGVEAAGATTSGVGQPGVLHDAQDDGRDA